MVRSNHLGDPEERPAGPSTPPSQVGDRLLPGWTAGRSAAALGFLAGLLVLVTLGDPGITIDEPLDVRPGRTYVATLLSRGWQFFDRDVVTTVFRDNAEHPPLGRWLLGLASTLGEPFEALLGGPDPFAVHAGRLAPALAFGILVALVARTAGRHFGRAAGVAAGVALVMMPRVFAHAHFAALDTFLALFWTLALVAAADALERRRTNLAMVGAGALWGLALLTKIQAWLLPPIVLAYALNRRRQTRTIAALTAWMIAGLVVFVAGWPWLWYDTAARLRAYFGTAGPGRASLLVQYFGLVYQDRDVPWHYPWFYFAVTVPVGLQALGVMGLIRGLRIRRTDPFPLLLAGSILMFLSVFSTKAPVYDGERLFLTAFPLWAILIGLGFGEAWRWANHRHWIRVGLVLVLLSQGYGVVALHPFGLSYFNALVGGLPGAERLGLELTYWGDAVDPILLEQLAKAAQPGQTAALIPTLHQIQATATLTPDLNRRQISLQDQSAAPRADWLLVYRRTAYWPPELRTLLPPGAPLSVRSRQGVWLSALWRVPERAPTGRKEQPGRPSALRIPTGLIPKKTPGSN